MMGDHRGSLLLLIDHSLPSPVSCLVSCFDFQRYTRNMSLLYFLLSTLYKITRMLYAILISVLCPSRAGEWS